MLRSCRRPIYRACDKGPQAYSTLPVFKSALYDNLAAFVNGEASIPIPDMKLGRAVVSFIVDKKGGKQSPQTSNSLRQPDTRH